MNNYLPAFLRAAASVPDSSSEILGIKRNLAGGTGG